MAREDAEQIVPEPNRPEREWITETQFWHDLERDFPNLRRQVRTLQERRQASGRIKRGQRVVFVYGSGGLFVKPYDGHKNPMWSPVIYPYMPRGQVILTTVEWDSREDEAPC